MNLNRKYYKVALLSPPYSTLTYAPLSWLEDIALGTRLMVPLGRSYRVGVLLGFEDEDFVSKYEIKKIVCPIEKNVLLSADYLDFIYELSLRQGVSIGYILGSVLPIGLRTLQGISYKIYQDSSKPKSLALKSLVAPKDEICAELKEKWSSSSLEIVTKLDDSALNEQIVLNCDPPWQVRPNAQKQREVLDYLLANSFVTRRRILSNLGQDYASVLDSLTKAKLIQIKAAENYDLLAAQELEDESAYIAPAIKLDFQLSEEQNLALEQFDNALGSFSTHLLFGVTGSGKTAVFLELAKRCLAKAQSILILAPELAIALKLRADVEKSIPDAKLYFYHGYQNPKLRERTFQSLRKNSEPCIIVGTRSALFLTLPKLAAIILDEEHDSSFKQDEGFNYQAKELAWLRAKQNSALLLFASATPDIKSFYASQNGQMPIAMLTKRVSNAQLPKIEKVNICGHDKAGALLSETALNALKETVDKGEQAVVLLNRRGYAPHVYCLDCGTVARCPHCDIALSYHKKRGRLICHYCDYQLPFPSICTKCKSINYIAMGEGTERIQEQLASLVPGDSKVLRLDRDSTKRIGQMEQILSSFARKEAQILVGTQMLSKGHHFPDVTLAVIADADLGLNIPDYRATERSFQLLTQSSGRAGRGTKKGLVILQTRELNHYCWNFVEHNDYLGFYAHEIELREKRLYPPFIKLALIRISHELDYQNAQDECQELATQIRLYAKKEGVRVLGPAPAPLAILKGRKRIHCLLKAQNWQNIRHVYLQAIQKFNKSKLKIDLDLDPINML